MDPHQFAHLLPTLDGSRVFSAPTMKSAVESPANMSLAVYTPIKDPDSLAVLFDFLDNEYGPWSEILGEEADYSWIGPFTGESLGGVPKCVIGFECDQGYSAEVEYHYAILRWLALQCGQRKTHFDCLSRDLAEPVPYIVCSDSEGNLTETPVFFHGHWHQELRLPGPLVDPCGMWVHPNLVLQELAWYNIPEYAFRQLPWGATASRASELLEEAGYSEARRQWRAIYEEMRRLDMKWQQGQ